MRRSESVFTIKRVRENGDIRTLTTNFDYGKNRSASDSLSTSFTWDDGAGMFISCDTPEKKPAAQKKRDVLLEQLRELQPTYNYTALAEAIMVKTGKSIAAAKSQITRFSNAGKIIRDGDLWKIAPNDDFFTMDGGNE
jgi:hypothetical protein